MVAKLQCHELSHKETKRGKSWNKIHKEGKPAE